MTNVVTEGMSVFTQSLIYSCIAFSIVFIVLGGLTLVIYAMRVLTGNSSGPSAGGSAPGTVNAAPAPKTEPAQSAAAQATAAPDVKGRHVAAITAAILALTNGGGRILSVTPFSSSSRVISSESTRMWRTAAIIQSVGRRLAPSWKR